MKATFKTSKALLGKAILLGFSLITVPMVALVWRRNGASLFPVALVLVLGIGAPAYADFVPGTILVAHQTSSGTHIISQLDADGNLLRQFGAKSSSEFRDHLALAGGFLFRSNGLSPGTISQFSDDGALVRTITPDSSPTPRIVPIASDFDNQSVFLVDIDAGTNVIRHLDDPSIGASSPFVTISFLGVAGISDLNLGGPSGSRALFALAQTSPPGPYRVAKIESGGSVQFFDSAELIVPFVFDFGSVAVDPTNGNVYVATGGLGTTTGKIVKFDAAGNALGSFSVFEEKPSLDVDSAGNIYIGHFTRTTGEISVFSPAGALIKTISIPDATRIVDVLIVPGRALPPAVAIDIKPGSFPNSINPKSKGVIPVAILTTGTFDATTVDSTTVLFGATGSEAAPVHAALEDVDLDGDTDMILHFNTQDTDIQCGDSSASLSGETFSGQLVQGSDSIKTAGCK